MKIKSIMKRTAIIGMIMTLGIMSFTACGNNSGDDNSSGSDEKKVVIAGSTSVQPLSEALAEKYMADNEGTVIEVQGGGSGQGIKAIEEKIADFGALSREVKDDEKSIISNEYVIAKDGIAVIINKDTTIDNITIDQVRDIYTGKITNWKDIGGPDEDIVVISREEGSGTRSAFTEITEVTKKDESGKEVDGTISSAIVQGSTGAVTQTVSGTPFSIGYISLGSLNNTVKALKVNDVEPTSDNVIKGDYKLSRSFIYVSGADLSESAQSFLDFVMSDAGQNIISESGFISVK